MENIIQDIKTLGLQHQPITYTSDYFPQLQASPPTSRASPQHRTVPLPLRHQSHVHGLDLTDPRHCSQSAAVSRQAWAEVKP